MKWTTLLKDLKEKVGLNPQHSTSSSSSSTNLTSTSLPLPLRSPLPSSSAFRQDNDGGFSVKSESRYRYSTARDKHGLELDFKRFWDEFRASSSEKEKEMALNMAVDVFCKLSKLHANIAQLVTMLVETHIFSFVVGRAFVTDIEKLKISSKARLLNVGVVLRFFSEVTQDGISPGANLLQAIEILVSGPIDKQSLLDSGILCCLIHILNALLGSGEGNVAHTGSGVNIVSKSGSEPDSGSLHTRKLEVEGSVVHIMKALSSHPCAVQSLIEDDSLQLLFQMVVNGSLIVFSQYKDGLVPLHSIQLHRHAKQILGLLLVNDNGSAAKYIRKHHLIKALLMAIKDFNPDYGDPSYTIGIVDLLLECIELSHRPEAGGMRLREDIRNAHGYPFLVQFALTLASMPQYQSDDPENSKVHSDRHLDAGDSPVIKQEKVVGGDSKASNLSPPLCRLLDVLVNLAQTGPVEPSASRSSKSSNSKSSSHARNFSSSSDLVDDMWEKDSGKVKDLESVQMLQDIFLKADSTELQAEVLNRMFKIFSSHIENYKLCQELRTVPLFILNMAGFPLALQEIILKILEYAVTVVNCIPEQELLSLCCLLQQPITSELKHTILSFFVKLLSFDQQYKKVLREVGVLEVLLDDLKHHMFQSQPEQQNGGTDFLEGKPSPSGFQKHMESKDAIITSPRLMDFVLAKSPLFEAEVTISIAWDCMVSLLKKAEANQSYFRSANGVAVVLPLLISDVQRSGVLRTLSCLIIEDVTQVHAEELGAILEVMKSEMVISVSGSQYKLHDDAKCDVLGALWRILGVNTAAQRVFGEVTGFSLLLTILHSFQSDGEPTDQSSLRVHVKVLTYLLRAVAAAVCDNPLNRTKLHSIISSHAFYDLLCESGLLSVDFERQVVHLLLELALELVIPPFSAFENVSSSDNVELSSFVLTTPSGVVNIETERVYNAGAVGVIIRSLLLFTPKVQLEVLELIEKLARAGSFNQENLTSVGCVELLLEIVHPFLQGSSPLLSHALRIVEVLGAYKLSTSELRLLVRYVIQLRNKNSSESLIGMMEKLILMEDMASDRVALAPFIEMDMSKMGHASVQVSLGERSWPPVAGYSFACWFQYQNFLKSTAKETEQSNIGARKSPVPQQQILRLFSVGSVDSGNLFYAELFLQEDGTLTLATSNSSSLSFSCCDLEENQWHHLAVVHSKPNALAGLFQASIAYIYLNGRLRHTGKLGYSPSPAGKPLHITIGTPATHARVGKFKWKIRSCYLFEEVLASPCICFMYVLGRGYRGLFQDADLLQFVPNQACGGDSMAILDSWEADVNAAAGTQKPDSSSKQGISREDGSGIVWDFERLGILSLQLSGKKLIFAFDGTSEPLRASGTHSLLNLVDPTSAAASPIGGIPRFGHLQGDIYACKPCVIGDIIHSIGGIAVVLALIEAAETREMLHMSLSFLACALHQNPNNVRDMQACRGYHLLSLFLYRRMSLFDMHCLEIFFKIAACEASFSEPKKLETFQVSLSPATSAPESSFEEMNLSKYRDELPSIGSLADDDYSAQKDTFSHISELEASDMPTETSNCIVLSSTDMVEHVLLDWTLWVTAQVSIQIALLNFLEHLVSIHWYRYHNLTVLRRINLVQHLLVTLQRGDVEVPVLEKLVVLLGVILEDGYLASELEGVVRFVIMTFDPPELTNHTLVAREPMGKHIIVRNMLLEMLIDLQVTIKSEEFLEQWHKMVSSRLIAYFLDEAVHPSSMKWIMTLLGVCLTSSPTFSLKFRTSGGYQGLTRVLPSLYDSPDIYYILFCLMFGKPVYPRLPEVRMLDFHALVPSDGDPCELKFVELLESVTAMAKSTFDGLSMQSMLAHQTGNLSQVGAGLVAELTEDSDTNWELQGEALMHKTYAARLMGGEASAPAATTSVLRFMVDLAKMCPPFSFICRRPEFLETCVDLYFSCARAFCAVKLVKEISVKTEEKTIDFGDTPKTFSSLPPDLDQSGKTSISVGSFTQGQTSMSSLDISISMNSIIVDRQDAEVSGKLQEETIVTDEENLATQSKEVIDKVSVTTPASLPVLNSPLLSERSGFKWTYAPSPSPLVIHALEPYFSTTSSKCSSVSEVDLVSDKSNFQGSSTENPFFVIHPSLLLEIDDAGYGGGPCSAASTAVLDFLAEVLADVLTEQLKAVPMMERILQCVPLYADTEAALVFQGICLSRVMNFLERRLFRDDEEDAKKLDKNRWSSNLEAFGSLIVDRVYMGAFPRPAGVLRSLEFLLSMLQLANKYGRIEEASPAKGLLSIGRGSKQLDSYISAILKCTNRMILYCFLPSFLGDIGEYNLLSSLGFLNKTVKEHENICLHEEAVIDIYAVLQLLVAHIRIVFCPSNVDAELNSCLCVNLISLLRDERQNVSNMAIDIFKYLLVHRRTSFEVLLVSKSHRLDVLHGGFDKLLTGSLSSFFEWFQSSEEVVNQVIEVSPGHMWVQHIAASTKFPGVRIKSMENHRGNEMTKKSKELARVGRKHREHIYERRYGLELVRDAMSTELRVVRQDKYGWVLHAESEWNNHLQQLVHERGIFPVRKTLEPGDPEWQLCPIEGPYRMRKKLEHCKLKIDSIQNVPDFEFDLGQADLCKKKNESCLDVPDSGSFSQLFVGSNQQRSFEGELYVDLCVKEFDDARDVSSARAGLFEDRASSMNESSLHSAMEFGARSSAPSGVSDSIQGRYELESAALSYSMRSDDIRVAEDRKELLDNGEYLIRPYLEPFERIRFRYNCERVIGLDKHDGIFLIGELCLYIIENFYIDDSWCICEKESEDELSVIDQALGVKKDPIFMDFQSKSTPSWSDTVKTCTGGRVWAFNGGAWGKEKVFSSGNLPHPWRMWKLNSVHEMLKRDYQLRPVAVEIFSMDGCNDLLVFHKKEREEVFKNLIAMNLPRNSMLDTTISGVTKPESNEGSLLFGLMAKTFSKRWQTGEISNFQYLMHLNTLAGRGYSDLTQYPVFPWVLADYESKELDLTDPNTFRRLDKPMGCQTVEGEEEFRKRYESWDDPEVPKFHYGSHYSSAGIVLFYLIRLPPFSMENQKLQGGQFDHADRLFNNVRDTWSSAAGRGNTSDVKELIPEFYYLHEFLENRFNLDLGEKQSGEKVGDVVLPPWAKGSAREFIRKHREALECEYVSENLHHWIDLIFGYRQRGKAAAEAVNVFYHYTYEGNVDIDAVSDPAMKASILAQINHFGQTPKQLFQKPHVRRRVDRKPPHPLKHAVNLVPHTVRKYSSSITQIVTVNDKVIVAGANNALKPRTYCKYVAWGFPDRSLRIVSYDQHRLLSTHENLHGGNQIQCAGVSHDGQTLVTGGDEGLVCVWRIRKDSPQRVSYLMLEKKLAGHAAKISCLYVSQPYMLVVSGSDDCTVILWDLSSLGFIRQLPEFQSPVSAIHVNDLTGEILTASGVMFAVWSINGDCLAVINTSQLPSDFILSLTGCISSDWQDTHWYATGHQSGAIKLWKMVHSTARESALDQSRGSSGLVLPAKGPEYQLLQHKILKYHKHRVTALYLTPDLKHLFSGDSGGRLVSWTLPGDSLRGSSSLG